MVGPTNFPIPFSKTAYLSMTQPAFFRKQLNSNSLPVEGRPNGFTNRTESARTSEENFARRVLSKCAHGHL